MDPQLEQRLQAIQEAAEMAAVNAGGEEVDLLPLRNEIGEAEQRLAELVTQAHDAVSRVARLVEMNSQELEQLRDRVDEISGTVDAIHAELPAG